MKVLSVERIKWLGCLILLAATFLAAMVTLTDFPNNNLDPDRYYHLALSREMNEKGVLKSLPQAEDVGWAEKFVDKEFLFHVFTAAGHFLGGEKGVLLVVPFLGLAIVGSIFYIATSCFGLWAASISMPLILFNLYFLQRLSMLRPHLLAILLALWLVYGFLKKKRYVLAFVSFLYPIAYHTFFIPGLLMFAFATVALMCGQKRDLRLLLYSIAGFILGNIFHPYFPENIYVGWQHFMVATGAGIPKENLFLGAELYPMTSDSWAIVFIACLFSGLIALSAVFWGTREDGGFFQVFTEKKQNLLFLFCLVLGFILISLKNPRGGEYLVPFAVFLLAGSVKQLNFGKKGMSILGGAFLAFSLGIYLIALDQNADHEKKQGGLVQHFPENAYKALRDLDGVEKGAKVFSDDWDHAPSIFYARPDLRFSDLLDPTFMLLQHRGLVILRDSLAAGTVADAYSLMKSRFGADYATVRKPGLLTRLESDPNFIRIYPGYEWKLAGQDIDMDALGFVVYRLRPQRVVHQLYDLSIALKPDVGGARDLDWSSLKEGLGIENDHYPTMFDMRRWLKAKQVNLPFGGKEICVLAKLGQSIYKEHVGAEYLGVGGGQKLRVFWGNKQIYFHDTGKKKEIGMIRSLLPLPTKLAKDSPLRVEVCSPPTAPFHSLALSLWTKKQIEDICSEKRIQSLSKFLGTDAESTHIGLMDQTCLGPIAARGQL